MNTTSSISNPLRFLKYLSLAAMLALCGCASSWKQVSAKPFKGPSRAYVVQLPSQWKRAPTTDQDQLVLTRDGLSLQQIRLLKLSYPQAFPSLNTTKEKQQGAPAWADLLPEELGEQQYKQLRAGYPVPMDNKKEEFEGILAAFTVNDSQPSDGTTDFIRLEPETLDNKPVFLLETKSYNNWGLEYRTLSYGVVHENNYWLLQYSAPRLYYFDTYLPEFLAFKDSLKLKESCFIFCGE